MTSTQQLLRLSRSLALPSLKQGTTLTVRSRIPNVCLRIESGWRDDGRATLAQNFPREDEHQLAGEMVITQEANQMTSLGRSESHLSISLEPRSEPWSVSRCELKEGKTQVDFQDGDAQVTAWFEGSELESNPETTTEYDVTVEVPEQVNLICELDQPGCSVEVANKIEGDVKLLTSDGSIRAKKLRGHTIELETRSPKALIFASDLLEAQNLKVNLQGGGRLRAKRIHGHAVDVRVATPTYATSDEGVLDALDDDDEGSLVDVSSMYVSGTGGAHVFLEAGLRPHKRGVRIKSHHGPVLVTVSGVHKPSNTASESEQRPPLVELGSVNGSCEVSIRDVPDLESSNAGWVACQAHFDSISPESVSLISTDTGDVGLTFDRKLEADIRLLSILDKASLHDKASILADEDDAEQVIDALVTPESRPEPEMGFQASRISIKTPSFTRSESFVSADKQTEYVAGWVENKSHEPDSRFEMKTRGKEGLGKIRLDGAANQALTNFSSPRVTTDNSARPLIVAATVGNITVETLSWLGAIARRYGLDEKGRELGRQATRRGRVVLPADE